MKRIVIYTASFGGHDEPLEIFDAECDLVCFTDNEKLGRKLRTWDVRLFPPTPLFLVNGKLADGRMRAKRLKLGSGDLFAGDYEHSIWLDAAFWMHNAKGFVEHCLAHLHDGIAMYPHPAWYRSLEREAQISQAMPKYAGTPLVDQVASYRRRGLEGGRLICGGVIARKQHSVALTQLEELWWQECIEWSPQDQLSLPWVLKQTGITPGLIPGDIYSNNHLAHLWSGIK